MPNQHTKVKVGMVVHWDLLDGRFGACVGPFLLNDCATVRISRVTCGNCLQIHAESVRISNEIIDEVLAEEKEGK
jgi:hypothetical protein